MDAQIVFFIMIGFLLLSLFIGNWVFVALGLTGIVGLILMNPKMLNMIAPVVWGSLRSPTLSAGPLFIFMGEIILRSGISTQTYNALSRLLGALPGGLLHTNVVSCASFAAISGSSVATTATIGTVAIPDQRRLGYERKLALGSIAASGTMGILIPPSVNMIIYGAFVETSIGRLFAGGIIPGLIMAIGFMIYIATRAMINPSLAPRVGYPWREKLAGLKDLIPIIVLIAFIFGAIFGGIMTPTETAGVAGAAALIITVVMRRFSWRLLHESATSALGVSCMILLIMGSASIAAYALTIGGVPVKMMEWIASSQYTKMQILIVIYLMYLALGCIMEGISMMMMTLPFVLPILLALNINLVWFGVVLIVLIEAGMITPPLGVTLYVALGIDREATFGDVVKGILPFLCIQVGIIALLTAFPILVLFFPNLVFGPM